jgi:cell division protein FtsA
MVRSTPPERKIISVLPQNFTVDGFEGIKDPRGMIGVRLEMSGILFTGPKTIVHNIQKAVEKADLHIDGLAITPLSLGSAILEDGEKEFGTILIDLGGGQTTTSVMHNRELKFSVVNPEGGDNVTKDVSVVLNTSHSSAEALKINYGNAYPEHASGTEEFPVDVIGQEEPVKVTEKYLAEIIEARLVEIFNQAKDVLLEINALNVPGGIVLTGGAASIPGMVELAQAIFEVNVRLHVPSHMGLRNPVFSSVISLVEYAASLTEINRLVESARTGNHFVPINSGYGVKPCSISANESFEQTIHQEEYTGDDYEEEYVREKGEGIVQWAKKKWSKMFD